MKSISISLALAIMGISTSIASAATPVVEKLASGVTITHTVQGTGAKPGVSSVVTVDYTGKFQDGRIFDTSANRGPTTFPLQGVIPCWREALQHIAVGGQAVVQCPAATAYGARGAGNVIPPNTDLQFEVSLKNIRN